MTEANIVCTHHPRCDLPWKSKSSVAINHTEICYDAWNKATEEERNYIRKVTDMHSRGLITRQEFSDNMSGVCYHHIDPTFPVAGLTY